MEDGIRFPRTEIMKSEPIPRIDGNRELREKLLPLCRVAPGEVWEDPAAGHRLGVLDAESGDEVAGCMGDEKAVLGIHDPPYNIRVGKKRSTELFQGDPGEYIRFSRNWVNNALRFSAEHTSLYIWLGADQKNHFQPLPEFMLMMREFPDLRSRSYITLRNQRGYGTQKNWMCIRQELLMYTRGDPAFSVVYTDIPKVLKGYYKTIGGKRTENLERSRSDTIRPGNVWLDIQQVFYRMEENVPGAYAQKPLSAILRIMEVSSKPGDLVADFFSHSGTTLLAAELLGRRCYTLDKDPVFVELSLRRLEHYRKTGKRGWQTEHPFPEIAP